MRNQMLQVDANSSELFIPVGDARFGVSSKGYVWC